MSRNYAAIPYDYLNEMEVLSDAEFGRLVRALLVYSSTGEVPALSGSEKVLFPRVRATEDKFKAAYEELIQKRKNAAKKSWESRKWASMQSNAVQCTAYGCSGLQSNNNKNNNNILSPYGEENINNKSLSNDSLLFVGVREKFIQICKDLRPPREAGVWTSARKKTIAAAKMSLEEWEQLFKAVSESDFLCGKKTDWKASFDWIIKPANRQKILEGTYRNTQKPKSNGNPSGPTSYNIEEFESALLEDMMGGYDAEK